MANGWDLFGVDKFDTKPMAKNQDRTGSSSIFQGDFPGYHDLGNNLASESNTSTKSHNDLKAL